jgi:hypothetical protein
MMLMRSRSRFTKEGREERERERARKEFKELTDRKKRFSRRGLSLNDLCVVSASTEVYGES